VEVGGCAEVDHELLKKNKKIVEPWGRELP
jgi:hypothetical protein